MYFQHLMKLEFNCILINWYILQPRVLNWIVEILIDMENKTAKINIKPFIIFMIIHLLLIEQLKYIFVCKI